MKLLVFLVSVVLILTAHVPYIVGVFRGKTSPHPATWLSWAMASTVLALILMLNGGGYATWSTWLMVLIDVTIFILALRYRVATTITRSDVVCFVASLLAMAVWLSVDQPFLSILLLIVGQFLAFVPSVRKAYSRPHDESVFTWSVNAARHTALVVIVDSYSPTTVANSLFWALVFVSTAAFLVVRRHQLDREKNRSVPVA